MEIYLVYLEGGDGYTYSCDDLLLVATTQTEALDFATNYACKMDEDKSRMAEGSFSGNPQVNIRIDKARVGVAIDDFRQTMIYLKG